MSEAFVSGAANPKRRRRLVSAVLLGLVVVSMVACGSDETASTSSTTESTELVDTNAEDALVGGRDESSASENCPDIETVGDILGGDVRQGITGGASFGVSAEFSFSEDDTVSTNDASYGFDGCSFSLADFDAWGEAEVVWLTSETLEGADLFNALAEEAQLATIKAGFVPLTGFVGEAYQDGQSIAVHASDAMLIIEFQDDDASETVDQATLLAQALERSNLIGDGSLPNCDSLIDKIPTSFGAVDSVRGPGGSFSIDDLNIDYWGCEFTFADGSIGGIKVAKPGDWDQWVVAKQSSPITKSYSAFDFEGVKAFDTGSELFLNTGDKPIRVTAEGDDLRLASAETRLGIARVLVANI